MSCTILGPLSSSSVSLPFYSFRVPAGFPSPAQDHIEAEISLDELLDLRAPHMYLVRISGDSMIDAGLFDGDLAIVNKALEGRPGLIVIAALNGDTLVKRLAKEGEQIILRAENEAYAPRYVLEGDELLIWGVVTHSVHCHAPG